MTEENFWEASIPSKVSSSFINLSNDSLRIALTWGKILQIFSYDILNEIN